MNLYLFSWSLKETSIYLKGNESPISKSDYSDLIGVLRWSAEDEYKCSPDVHRNVDRLPKCFSYEIYNYKVELSTYF